MDKIQGIGVLWDFEQERGPFLHNLEKTVPCDLFGASCPKILTASDAPDQECLVAGGNPPRTYHLVLLSTIDTTLSSLFSTIALHVASWARSLSFSNAKSNFSFDSSQPPLVTGFED